MTERTEWPTEAKLAELRELGHVSYSKFSTSIFALITFVVVLCSQDWSALGGKTWDESVDSSAAIFDLLLRLIVVPTGSAAIGAIVWGLVQTRFFFSWNGVTFNLSRLFRPGNGVIGLVVRPIVSALIVAAAIGAGLIVGWYLFDDIATLLNRDVQYWSSFPKSVFRGPGQFLLFVFGGIGLIALAVNKIAFRWRHRMTRKEVLSEEAR